MQELAAAPPALKIDAPQSHELDGQWRVALCIRSGQESSWFDHLEIWGDTFSPDYYSPVMGRIVLLQDPEQPSEIDFVFGMECGLHSGDRIEGIYRLVGEQMLLLNLGLDIADEAHYERPESFSATKHSTLLVLRRET